MVRKGFNAITTSLETIREIRVKHKEKITVVHKKQTLVPWGPTG